MDQLRDLAVGVGVVVGSAFAVWLWLKRTTGALDAIPGLVQRVEDALKVAEQALTAADSVEDFDTGIIEQITAATPDEM